MDVFSLRIVYSFFEAAVFAERFQTTISDDMGKDGPKGGMRRPSEKANGYKVLVLSGKDDTMAN